MLVERIGMEYKVDLLNEGARVTSVYPAATGQSLEEGDPVTMTATGWTKTADGAVAHGIVFRGQVDNDSVAVVNKPVVILGNALVRIAVSKLQGATTVGQAIGDAVELTGATGVAAATIGKVLEIEAGKYVVVNIA